MEKTSNSKTLRIAVSILLAVALWMYVGKSLNRDEEKTVRGLPVNFSGIEMLEERGLMITQGQDQTVSVQVKAKENVIDQINSSTISATVDVSDITQPGTYARMYQVAPSLMGGVSSSSAYSITAYRPENVNFTVSKLAERTIPIQGSFTGSVADGYQAGTFTFSPESLKVRGEESLVNQIYYALVVLDQKDISETYNGDLPYTFISFNGEEIGTSGLETNVELVRTVLPVVQLKEVPLTVNFLPGGGATEADITYEIQPVDSIVVSGPAADLEPLKSISLGDIDLSKVIGSDTITKSVEVAPGLTNESGISEVTVKVRITGLSTAVFEVDNIELTNKPSGFKVEQITKSRQVTVRGSEDALATISASQLRIVADLKEISNVGTATGTQTVPVKVYLDGRSDVGVVGEYSISVSVSR